MNIGILQTGKININIRDRFGNYPDMFKDLLSDKPLADPNNALGFTVFDVTEQQMPESPKDCDGYIITGSSAGVYEDHIWLEPLFQFIRECAALTIPLVGICFGHQAIAKALGGEVGKFSGGWGVGNRRANIENKTALEYAIGCKQDAETIKIPYFHQDQVISLPKEATVTVSDDFCAIGGYVIDNQILCFQGHPEFNSEYLQALTNVRKETLGEAVTTAALASADDANDRHLVGQWIADFFANHQPN